jgi:Glycosyl hydrolase family 12
LPIGTNIETKNIAGNSWNVWVGPRGVGPGSLDAADLTPDGAAPVVTYVTASGDIRDSTFDLKDFITDAVGRSANGSKTFEGTFYLTDVFAGFEIWDGGAGGNLGVDEFTCVVNP